MGVVVIVIATPRGVFVYVRGAEFTQCLGTVCVRNRHCSYHLGERGLDLDKRQLYETDTR